MRKVLFGFLAGALLAAATPFTATAAPLPQANALTSAAQAAGTVKEVLHRPRHRRWGSGWHGRRDSRWHSRWESRGRWHGRRDSRWHSRRESRWGLR